MVLHYYLDRTDIYNITAASVWMELMVDYLIDEILLNEFGLCHCVPCRRCAGWQHLS